MSGTIIRKGVGGAGDLLLKQFCQVTRLTAEENLLFNDGNLPLCKNPDAHQGWRPPLFITTVASKICGG